MLEVIAIDYATIIFFIISLINIFCRAPVYTIWSIWVLPSCSIHREKAVFRRILQPLVVDSLHFELPCFCAGSLSSLIESINILSSCCLIEYLIAFSLNFGQFIGMS